jgi:integrase
VRGNLQRSRRTETGWVIKMPKTKRSRRQIALSEQDVALLRAHQRRQKEERLLLGPAWEGAAWDLVFCSPLGNPLHARSLVHQFKKHLRLAGLPDVRFHDLRHTCATLLLSARVNPKVVSEILGHASVSVTLDLYNHVIPDMQQDAAETMGRMLYG